MERVSRRAAGHDHGRALAKCGARLAGVAVVVGLMIGAAVATPVRAQSASCTAILCAPSLVFESALNRSHLFGGPAVRSLTDGSESHLPSQSNLGTGAVRANEPSATFGVSVDAVTSAMTKGWVTVAPYVGDLYSTAARPDDQSAYTHKLDTGLNVGVGILNWLSPHVWLRTVKGFVILDDVLVGLPRAGDEVPRSERLFLTDARPATLIAGLSVPLAPLDPHA